MASIIKGQPNTTDKVNWFITVGGALNNAFEVGFRITDIVGGLPGTQIFPTTPGEFENVTSPPGRFGTGSYFAYDNTAATPWTPGTGTSLGTHRIEWRWKIISDAFFQTGREDFEVLPAGAVVPGDLYITVEDIRDLGMPDPPTDAEVLVAIEVWQTFLERACRQWFIPKTMVLALDGTDSDAIHFGVPIISIDHIKINNEDTVLDTDLFKVYSAVRYPDDRHNPRIKLVAAEDQDIFTAPLIHGQLKFRKGRQNQEVKGTFGYVEEDGSVPPLIQHALKKLVVEKLTTPIFMDPTAAPLPAPPPLVGPIVEEWVDSHKVKYGQRGGMLSPRKPGLTGITSDQEILDIIKLFRAPIGAATPAHPSFT